MGEGGIRSTRPVVEMFLAECRRSGLDPIAKEIYCIERGGKWSIEVGINGIRGKAEETGKYGGQTEPQWSDDGVTWVDVWVKDTPPAAARVGIIRTDWASPAVGVVTYAGYVPRNKAGGITPTGQWQFNSPNQLLKCAEMQAFRKAFPRRFTGLYIAEELESTTSTESTAPAAVSEDWAALIRAVDDKADLEALTLRIRGIEDGEKVRESEMTGDLRTIVMTHASTLTKDSREPREPEAAPPVPPATGDVIDAEVIPDDEPAPAAAPTPATEPEESETERYEREAGAEYERQMAAQTASANG
ncbi:recombinase RecT [Cryobacterium sp. 10I5]|uniref:recombinase RecT n=1 Tax=Cryobacterium sp. 10I5 TaxID=3048581 RepID=UPI002B230673|nr:recombinase RecT [Cryobacterium sp. 10I5]MEB0264761.1 recombinase RecT [Cryobacterium sp. 10I5]